MWGLIADISTVVLTIADDLCAFQSAIRHETINDPTEILNVLRRIDNDMCGWANPAIDHDYSYDPAVDTLNEPEAVWQGVYHVYKDHFVCELHLHIYARRRSADSDKDMTNYHYRNVRMYNGLLYSSWLTKTGEPPDSSLQMRLISDRLALIDDVLHGLPWRLNYRKINGDCEPVQSKHAPPIMW